MLKKGSLKNLVKPLGFVVCALFIVILFWLYSQNRTISLHYLDRQGITHSLTLPVKEKKRLAGLMQKLFAEDNFAYTILGPKPVAWMTYPNPLSLSDRIRFYLSFSKHNIHSGWKTWEKYQHLFPAAHLVAESSKCDPEWVSILMINEDRFNAIVNQNKRDFQEVLRREIVDGVQLIREANSRSLMDEVLEGHQGLIGTVLGYGRDNAWQFHEGCKNHTPIGWVWEDEKSYFGEDFGKEASKKYIASTDYYLALYSCPSFAGDPNSAESLALKAEYTLAKQKVVNYYKDKDFLEATLSLLAGYHPPE